MCYQAEVGDLPFPWGSLAPRPGHSVGGGLFFPFSPLVQPRWALVLGQGVLSSHPLPLLVLRAQPGCSVTHDRPMLPLLPAVLSDSPRHTRDVPPLHLVHAIPPAGTAVLASQAWKGRVWGESPSWPPNGKRPAQPASGPLLVFAHLVSAL